MPGRRSRPRIAGPQKKTALKARYRSLQAQEKTLAKHHAALLDQVSALQARQAEAQRMIAEADRVEAELQSHLDRLMERLEVEIDRDLPFLTEERAGPHGRNQNRPRPAGHGIAERSRRVMEAIKVETEYGQTVEVYQQPIHVGNGQADQAMMADILRVGRLALFWRSPDGKRIGQWDRVESRWTPLPDTYRRAINDAMEMALKRRTIDMVKLPIEGLLSNEITVHRPDAGWGGHHGRCDGFTRGQSEGPRRF